MPRKSEDPFYAQELPGLDGLNAVSATVRNDEEVCKYIESEHLSASQRFVYILEKGSDVQRGAIMERIQHTFDECDAGEVSRVIAALNDYVWQFDQPVQLAGANALQKALPTLGAKHVEELLELLQTMVQLKEERVRDAWADLLVAMMKYLPQSAVEGRVLEYALKLGELTEPQYCRMLCCRMLGPLAVRAPSAEFISGFLDKAMSLCQDTDYSVRAAMCAQLNSVARATGLATTKRVLTKELFELLADEEKDVARAAFSALLDLTDFFDAQFRRDQVYPLLRNYVANPPEGLRPLVCEEFGRLCHQTRQDIAGVGEDDSPAFLEFFRQAAQSPDPDTRRQCAYNFPAVASSLHGSLYAAHLQPIYKALCEDSHLATRESIAASMHEVAAILGDRAFAHLGSPFLTLLQDRDPGVRERLIRNLAPILNRFAVQAAAQGPEAKERTFSQFIPPLVEWWEQSARTSSSKQGLLLGHFSSFPSYFTQAQLHQTFIPLLIKHLATGPRTLCSAVATHLVHFTRCLQASVQEGELFSRFVGEFGRSRSYWHRSAFLDICRHSLTHYSRRWFRERLLDHCMELSRDSVSSVRRKLGLLLPYIRRALKPPAEVEQLAAFNQTVTKMQMDSNRDVAEVVARAAAEVTQLEEEMQRHQQGRAIGVDAEDDRRDAAKEGEEQALLELAKEQDKLERRQKIREMLKNEQQQQQQQEKEKQDGRGGKAQPKHGLPSPSPHGSATPGRGPTNVPALPGIAPGKSPAAGGGAAAVRSGGASSTARPYNRHGSNEAQQTLHQTASPVGDRSADGGPRSAHPPPGGGPRREDKTQKRASYGPPGSVSPSGGSSQPPPRIGKK